MAVLIKVGKIAEAGKRAVPVQEYAIDGGTPTVKDALQAAGLSITGVTRKNILVNSEPADLTKSLKSGDTVLLVPAARGA